MLSLFFSKLQVFFGIFMLKKERLPGKMLSPDSLGEMRLVKSQNILWYYISEQYTAIRWENMITYHLIQCELLLEISDHSVAFSLRN